MLDPFCLQTFKFFTESRSPIIQSGTFLFISKKFSPESTAIILGAILRHLLKFVLENSPPPIIVKGVS